MKVISAITLDELTDVLVDLEEEDDLEFDQNVGQLIKGYCANHFHWACFLLGLNLTII